VTAAVRRIVGILCCIAGAIWFTQGIGVLHGSFMTGQATWTVIGIVVFLAGLALLVRRGRRPA
jgi:uncharacterized membrane protein YhiD involved in acid resistance